MAVEDRGRHVMFVAAASLRVSSVMTGEAADRARVKLVAAHDNGALFVVAFGNGYIEIRDCESEDPTAVRASVAISPVHAAALEQALVEARAQSS